MSYVLVNDVDLYVVALENCVLLCRYDFAVKFTMDVLLHVCPRHGSNNAMDAFENL